MTEKTRCAWANASELLQKYHDEEYGFPVEEDVVYFERLILELFQAGLSWQTILNKRRNFRQAFDHFDFRKVAQYTEKDFERLLSNPGIIRNRLKITATIHNAQVFCSLIDEFGSFHNFLKTLPLDNRPEIVQIFKQKFKFMGPAIVEEFFMSTGHWPVKHEPTCFLY